MVHENIICNGCGMIPLVGIRYKCKSCQDFNYCEDCINLYNKRHKHVFYMIEEQIE